MESSDAIEQNIEQSQESAAPPHLVSAAEIEPATALAEQLVAELSGISDGDLVGEIVLNALKLLRDKTNRADIKLINNSMKELRYALKIFAPYRDVRKVSIFGSARTAEDHPDYISAAEFGKKMVAGGWMVTTGAGGGIMAAGHGGAGAEPSFGLAIRLPFEQKTNPFIEGDPKLINFKYFFTRKLMFVRSSHAIALFPGGFGTLDEGFEVLTLIQTGKCVPMPIVMVEPPGGNYWKGWQDYVENEVLPRKLINPEDLRLYKVTNDVDAAIAEVSKFYSNYHSLRYWRDEVIIRVHHKPTEAQLRDLQSQFGEIMVRGDFRVSGPLPIEKDEPSLDRLHRLVFHFNRREFGKLRILIDHLNDMV